MRPAHLTSLHSVPTIEEFAASGIYRDRQLLLMGLAMAGAVGAAYILAGASAALLILVGLPACCLILGLTWKQPKYGVFLLFAAATLLEGQKSGFPDQTTELVQFFRPLQEISPLKGVIFSMAESYMLILGVICLLKAMGRRQFRMRRGQFFTTTAILFAWWMFEVANGVATGGNLKLGLQELRIAAYALIMYLFTFGLLTDEGDLQTLGWILLIGTGLKGIQGCFRYFITFHRDISAFWGTGRSILEHYEAFTFNAFFFYVALLFLTRGPEKQKRVALFFLPFVFLANLYNHRRASDAATFFVTLLMVGVVYGVFRERRSLILRVVAIGAVLLGTYAGVFWNSSSSLALPVQSLKSQIAPSARDASSDQYRKIENANLYYTIMQSPILGFGFGKEFLRPHPMLDLRRVDPYLFVLPHNSILWVWMRLGTLGFLLFWWMNGLWLRQGYRTGCRYRDSAIRRWALFAMVVVIINLIIAYLDMGLYGMRTQIYLGVVLGVLDALPRLTKDAGSLD